MTDLLIASLSVKNFGGGESVRMSLKVALTAEVLKGGGVFSIVSDFIELVKTTLEFAGP